MFIAGIVIAAVGTAGIFTAVGMEVATHEPRYHIYMKIFPWIIGIGLALIGLGAASGL